MLDVDQPKFLITRLSAFGDCLVTLPVACALRDHFPDARIVWLTQNENAPLLRIHDDIDHVISVSRRWFFRKSEILQLRQELQQERFTAVIDPQSLSKSSAAGWLSGCPVRIGLDFPHGREVAPWVCTDRVAPAKDSHVVDRFLCLLKPLGVEHATARFRVPIANEAAEFADQYLERAQVRSPFVLVNPGAGWKSRLWSMPRYGQVIKELHAQFGLRAIVNWYGDYERKLAEEIVQHASGAATLAVNMNLLQLAAVTKRASLFVGSDSGPMHLASSIGTPCVSLHGTTRAELSGPYGRQHISLQAYYQGGSTRARRAADNKAMLAISSQEVVAACAQIILSQPHAEEGKEFASPEAASIELPQIAPAIRLAA